MDPPLALVVDDDPDYARALARMFPHLGLRARMALEGPAALEALREERPALVCLDLMLPGMSGFELCEHIRRDGRLRGLPILVVTARTHPQDLALALEVGATQYLTKPVRLARLGQAVAALLLPGRP
jgi:CheY-like chemotaxis protein